VLLIVEDDVTFARILVDLAHDRGIRALVALRGATALPLAREFRPGAITLDITLPDMAGLDHILDRLKHDPATRHIPVHVITGTMNRRRGLALGAMTYLEKSVTKDNLKAAFEPFTIRWNAAPRNCCSPLPTVAGAPVGRNCLPGPIWKFSSWHRAARP
jgi:DNA-binding response OmpR family regulator